MKIHFMLRNSITALIISSLFVSPSFGCSIQTLAKLGIRDIFDPQPTMRAAADDVIKTRLGTKNAHLPKFGTDPLKTCKAGNCTFLNFQDLLKPTFEIPEIVPPYKLTEVQEGKGVELLETPKGNFYFRISSTEPDQVNAIQKVRRTLAASWINEGLGLELVAKSQWARIGGHLGTISAEAPGKKVAKLKDFLESTEVDKDSLSEALGFEFLVGNGDFVTSNVKVTPDGKLHTFDYDWAFDIGMVSLEQTDRGVTTKEAPNPGGTRLPEFYTTRFIENLKKRDAKWFRKKLEFVLSEDEIESVLFRRDVILRDYERHFGGIK